MCAAMVLAFAATSGLVPVAAPGQSAMLTTLVKAGLQRSKLTKHLYKVANLVLTVASKSRPICRVPQCLPSLYQCQKQLAKGLPL